MVQSSPQARRLVLMLLVTALALMTLDTRSFTPIDRARVFTIGLTQPARQAIGWTFRPLLAGWQGIIHYDELTEENAQLRKQVVELKGSVDQLPADSDRLAQLLDTTELSYAKNLPTVTTEVTSDRRSGLERIVEISGGANDGIKSGMAVVDGSGLVGEVHLVAAESSVVRLITDPRVKVGVRSAQGFAVSQGNGSGNDLLVEHAELAEPKVGRRAETSGLERSQFPKGIPVGKIVVDSNNSLRMHPNSDFGSLEYLSVILWEPQA